MINNGAPLEVIQSLLGYEKSETTKKYTQLSGKLRHDYLKNAATMQRFNLYLYAILLILRLSVYSLYR
jgi:hypothetical protein